MESFLVDRLSTLSHPQRMAIFRLLMRRCPDAVPAGEIAQALSLKPSTASVYLSALTQVKLITQTRDGTRLLYAVNLAAAGEVVSGLFVDCCGGRADLCPPHLAPLMEGGAPKADHRRNVLFVCTGNSARSIIAETILRETAGHRFQAYSAGTAHRSELNKRALDLLSLKGHDITPLHSKNIGAFQGGDAPQMDFVFTVCDRAANEECPTWPGLPASSHWGVPDPVAATGDEAEKQHAFQQAYTALHHRITAFTSLSLDQLDRATLQKRLDQIGQDIVIQDS